MTSRETLNKLNNGCSSCRVKMCNLCPVGSKKKALEKELGLTRSSFWTKVYKFIVKLK